MAHSTTRQAWNSLTKDTDREIAKQWLLLPLSSSALFSTSLPLSLSRLHPLCADLGREDRVFRLYGQPWRHYHTISHIEELLCLYNEHRDEITHHSIVQWAIWFHEYAKKKSAVFTSVSLIGSVIYQPLRNDNEELSALEWEKFADVANIVCVLLLTVVSF